MSDGTLYKQRDIVLIPFPYSDLSGAKQRPALIISNSSINMTQDRICCLITSNQTTEGIKINANHFIKERLPFQSWIKPHRIFAIHEKIIKKKLCTTTEELHEEVIDAIMENLKIEEE